MESAKWVGRASIDIPAATAEETWSVTGDFCAAHVWMQLDACRKVEGQESEPGCIRFCSSGLNWAKERLVEFDPVGRSYKYEVMENNMGFGQYLATFMVLSAEKGCRIEWSFEADPVENWTLDGLVSYLQANLEALRRKISLPENN
ncbi:hypothetical protein HPP92_005575 [Vanilla planifolia]|uniref:Lachrymatory factor synthase n=1 Tax=Vanilla planifolia TaxID=51239 RepID=A0A835RUA5_VANPL|nr:hypothetical protein HPP92_005575 [Vanilla planifolia]